MRSRGGKRVRARMRFGGGKRVRAGMRYGGGDGATATCKGDIYSQLALQKENNKERK